MHPKHRLHLSIDGADVRATPAARIQFGRFVVTLYTARYTALVETS